MIRRREFLISAGAGAGALAFGPALGARDGGRRGAAGPRSVRAAGRRRRQRRAASGRLQLAGSRTRRRAGRPQGLRLADLPGRRDHLRDAGRRLDPRGQLRGAGGAGGASAIRFTSTGAIADAYRILGGTSTNCSGGRTPWGSWLSGEEEEQGWIFECDPTGATPAVRRDALGSFKHEAACVDPFEGHVYLTEDLGDGGLYRFTPAAYPDLAAGVLEIATVGDDGHVSWAAIPNPIPSATDTPTRQQVPGSTQFARGEGIWYDAGVVYVATTSDETIHAYDIAARTISILYRQADTVDSPLQGVDNITVSRSGDLYVCEDSYDNDPDAMDVCMISREGELARFAKLTGGEHSLPGVAQSEITGVCFDPSGRRMYFGSQRAACAGAIYEVSGPFRLDRPGDAVRTSASSPIGAAIGIEFAHKATLARLLKPGLPIALTLDSPSQVTAVLTTAHSGRQRPPKVIARTSAQLPRGRGQLLLGVRGRERRKALKRRHRPLAAVLQVTISSAASRTAVGRRIKLLV